MVIRLLAISAASLLTACNSLVHLNDGPIQWETVDVNGYRQDQSVQTITVVRDQNTWNRLLDEQFPKHRPVSLTESVDFRSKMIVAVFLGARPNGCYSVRIENVYRKDARVKIEYSELVPFGPRMCTYSFIYPYHIISLPNSTDPVDFIRRADTPSS